MDSILFSISDVRDGWIFATLYGNVARYDAADSYLGGGRAVADLSEALTAILAVGEEAGARRVCWHGESVATIWELSAEDGSLHIRAYECTDNLCAGVAACDKTIFQIQCDLLGFTDCVLVALRERGSGEALAAWEASGFVFPRKEYNDLRRQLRARQKLGFHPRTPTKEEMTNG